MGRFDKGVGWYTTATVEIKFPEDDLACRWCPLYRVEMASNRRYCAMTGEILVTDATIGYDCPIKPQVVTEEMGEEMEEI